MFGACKRVRWDEIHPLWQMRGDRIDHRALDRPHIGDCGTCGQMRGHFARHGLHRANRHAKNHQIRTFDRACQIIRDMITKPDFARDIPRLGRAGIAHHLACKTRAAHRKRH